MRKLHRYLKQRGVQPWLDELDLLPGENWEVEIPKALFSSDVILVCLSKNSVNKEGFVQKEITFALDKALEKPEGTIFIVPVKLEDCEVPRRLKQYQWVDVFRQDGYKRLMLGLQKRASGLGADVSPVILDETRRTTSPKTPKPEIKKAEEQIVPLPVKKEIKEEPKKEIPAPALEEKEPEVKFTQQKPFTKLLDPSSLSPKGTSKLKSDKQIIARQRKAEPDFVLEFSRRLMGAGWILLLVILVGGFSLNYYFNNPLVPENTPSPTQTVTPKTPTFTSVPFTETPVPTNSAIPTPTLGIGSTMTGEHGETLVYVPAGKFRMGSDNGEDDEKPVHTVYLDAFWIDQTEVTNKQYQACVDAGTCEPPSFFNSSTHQNYYGNSEFDNYPVLYVNWDKANRYCEVWAGGDLPTEAQWEKAARGTDERTYPWGENINCNKSNYNIKCIGDISPVGNYESGKSLYGVFDMAGNVWEWVNDYYENDYYVMLDDNVSNPKGPSGSDINVLRGGSWYSTENDSRSADRDGDTFQNAGPHIGFRCARSP
ncbi:MAG: SUMF1/EgtB/PvdO family nonheme iron enzyme [Chloroflexi bacterium]|nr:SUMF1/EgtB/PvdO family nonheme iron enzyme [Chloroflexota bacterium]